MQSDWDQSMASGGVIPTDSIISTPSGCLSPVTEGREESQPLDSDPIKIQGTITDDIPVALCTRKSRQQIAHIRTNCGKGDLFQATMNQNKDNKLIRQ